MFVLMYFVVCGYKIWRRKARKMAKKGSSVISTGRVKDGVPLRGRPPGVHTGTRGRPPLHGVKYHTSGLDDASSLHYKVCTLVLTEMSNMMLVIVEFFSIYSFSY